VHQPQVGRVAADKQRVESHRPRRDFRLAKLAGALILFGSAVSGIELITLGHLTVVGVALDSIAGSLVPPALIAMFVNPPPRGDLRRADDDEEDDEHGGGGGARGDDTRPLGPSGGLDIDWAGFEREFHAYAGRVAQTLEPTRA
jgi:hypothetical protein